MGGWAPVGEAGIGEFTGTVGPLEPPFVKREEDDEGVDTGGGTAVHPRRLRRKIDSWISREVWFALPFRMQTE